MKTKPFRDVIALYKFGFEISKVFVLQQLSRDKFSGFALELKVSFALALRIYSREDIFGFVYAPSERCVPVIYCATERFCIASQLYIVRLKGFASQTCIANMHSRRGDGKIRCCQG